MVRLLQSSEEERRLHLKVNVYTDIEIQLSFKTNRENPKAQWCEGKHYVRQLRVWVNL